MFKSLTSLHEADYPDDDYSVVTIAVGPDVYEVKVLPKERIHIIVGTNFAEAETREMIVRINRGLAGRTLTEVVVKDAEA